MRKLIVLVVVVVCAFTQTASATVNFSTTFDSSTDTTGWNTFNVVTLSYLTTDADGSPLSGSMKAVNTYTGTSSANYAVVKCVTGIVAGTSYDVGGRIYVPNGQAQTGNGYLLLQWFSNADCTGTQTTTVNGGPQIPVGAWTAARQTFVAPTGAQSAWLNVGINADAGSVTGFEADFDDVFVATTGTAAAPAITSGMPTAGTVSSSYSFDFTATGSALITYSIMSGTMPPGISMSPLGHVSGTPTMAGSFPLTVKASNDIGTDATMAVTYTINEIPGPDLAIQDLPPDGGFAIDLSVASDLSAPADMSTTPVKKSSGCDVSAANSSPLLGSSVLALAFLLLVYASRRRHHA